jgi:serine/threonine protein kinase
MIRMILTMTIMLLLNPQRLLEYDPNKRISADVAQEHAFFKELKQPRKARSGSAKKK